MGGEFDQIIHHEEHSTPAVNDLSSHMVEMRDCFHQLDIFYLRFQGPQFTWSNKNSVLPVAKKLDRLLVNQNWITCYPNSQANFSAPLFSDHSPCILDLAVPLPQGGSKPFKLFNFLGNHQSFLQTVEAWWIQAGADASTISSKIFKLKSMKIHLKSLNKNNFSDIQKIVRD